MSISPYPSSDRLVDAMRRSNPDSRESWDQLLMKMEKLALTDAEYDYFIDALENTPNKVLLISILASGIWDNDRAAMHVLTRSYPYIYQIITHSRDTESRNPIASVQKLLQQSIHSSWIDKSRTNTLTDAEYDEMSAYINAIYLSKDLYLHTDVTNRFTMMNKVTIPLMENEGIITPALETIFGVWSAVRDSRSSRYLTSENVIDIAHIVDESPEMGPRLIAFATERGFYDTETAKRYAELGARAISEGVL